MEKYYLGEEIQKLERVIDEIKDVLKGKRELLYKLQKGGFSNDVFELSTVQDYIKERKGNCLGYIGEDRLKKNDKYLQENRPGTNKELASFICSKAGRYYSEEEKKDNELIKKYYLDFKKNNE